MGRSKEVRTRGNGITSRAPVAEYTCNGLNFRTGWHCEVTGPGGGSGGGAPDGTVDGNDPWYWFIYNERWQVVGTFRGAMPTPRNGSFITVQG